MPVGPVRGKQCKTSHSRFREWLLHNRLRRSAPSTYRQLDSIGVAVGSRCLDARSRSRE